MIWALIVIWVIGGLLFGFMIWAGAVGAVGVISRLERWSGSAHKSQTEQVRLHLPAKPACRRHVVHGERPSSWHLHALHRSNAGHAPRS